METHCSRRAEISHRVLPYAETETITPAWNLREKRHRAPLVTDDPLQQIVSGGQTGVDRAALDVALGNGIACGGWCPQGRRAEDGRIADRYPLRETPSRNYSRRTRWNVRDSDATLILTIGPPTGGTALTQSLAQRLGKPIHVVRLDQNPDPEPVRQWIATEGIAVMNVAGPRERTCPGIYEEAALFLQRLWGELRKTA